MVKKKPKKISNKKKLEEKFLKKLDKKTTETGIKVIEILKKSKLPVMLVIGMLETVKSAILEAESEKIEGGE